MVLPQARSSIAAQAVRPAFGPRRAPHRPASSLWRLIPPLAGVAISLVAYLAQNVWNLFHIQDVTDALRSLDPAGLAAALLLIGFVEGTVVLCFYIPGTAVVILLLLGLQPSWSEGVPLLAALMAGSLIGYAVSIGLGQVLKQRLPRLVGRTSFDRMRRFVDRFGQGAFAGIAFHPNALALAFSIVGYLGIRRTWLYLGVAALAQAAWWALIAATASGFSRQSVVTGGNFQLFLAALFSIWLLYELVSSRRE